MGGENTILFGRRERDVLYTRLADGIRRHIRERGLKPGDRIPSERLLAQEFNTSRNSVREALRTLERDRIIVVHTGRGAFVAERPPEKSFDLNLWKVSYIELLEIKAVLELHIIEELCGNLTSVEIKSLEDPLTRLERGAALGEFLFQEDFTFHSRLRKLANNSTMEQMIDNLVMALDDYGKNIEGGDSIWRETVPYHRDILKAIVENRPIAAREAYMHIYHMDRRALESMEQEE